MAWSFSDVTKLTEVKARYFFGVWVFGALLIFLPDDLKQQMAITIPDVVRPWVGFVTLASFVLWLVLALLSCASVIRNWYTTRQAKSEILAQLETLSQGERDIFLLCLAQNQRTIRRNIVDGSINSLVAKRLIVMAPQGGVLAMPYTIPKFVWDYIKESETELFPELSDQNAIQELRQRQQHGWMR